MALWSLVKLFNLPLGNRKVHTDELCCRIEENHVAYKCNLVVTMDTVTHAFTSNSTMYITFICWYIIQFIKFISKPTFNVSLSLVA